MNYYEHHIGDYAAATAHLSLVEDAIYSRMLRRYYLTEAPLPVQVESVARLVGAKSQDELAAVETVLAEFFRLADDGWHQKRCDEDIARYREKQGKARASAEARWNVKQGCERNANAMRTQCDGNAHQTPDTNHQTPIEKTKGGKPPLVLPDWLAPEVWKDWHDYRNGRKGWTTKARELSLRTLTELWASGHDPRAVIHQSIERGWTGLFPVRGAGPPAQAKPSAAADFRGKTYDATPIDQLPPDLRDAARAALADG